MPNGEIVNEKSITDTPEAQKSLFDDAYKFLGDTIDHPDARARQVFVAGYGAAIGGMKNIQELPNEFIKKPWETTVTVNVAKASIPGFAIGAAATAVAPEILEATAVVSIVSTAAALWHTCTNLMANSELQQSMDKVFKSDDRKVMDSGIKVASETLGPEAARYGIELTSALAGMYGSKVWKNISRSQLENKLHSYLPHTRAASPGVVEITFRDGNILHLHDNKAIYSIDGMEFPLHSSSCGTDINFLASMKGRQVIKAWREVELDDPFATVFTQKTRAPFEIVLAELLNSFSSKGQFMKKLAANYVSHLYNTAGYSIIDLSNELFINALKVYSRYADKDWGFIDCVSFCTMHDNRITEALTHDRHFKQMGFKTLLNNISSV